MNLLQEFEEEIPLLLLLKKLEPDEFDDPNPDPNKLEIPLPLKSDI